MRAKAIHAAVETVSWGVYTRKREGARARMRRSVGRRF